MQDTETLIYTALSTDAALLALVGTTEHISSAFPEKVTIWPYIVYRELNQRDSEFGDNLPIANDSTMVVDVFVKDADVYPYAKAVADIFRALFWTCEYSENTPDPDVRVQHRVMRFNRLLFAGDTN